MDFAISEKGYGPIWPTTCIMYLHAWVSIFFPFPSIMFLPPQQTGYMTSYLMLWKLSSLARIRVQIVTLGALSILFNSNICAIFLK